MASLLEKGLLALPFLLRCTWALTLTQQLQSGNDTDPASVLSGCVGYSCLQRYVAFDDGAFSWSIVTGPIQGPGWQLWVLALTSQAWMMASTHEPWQHQLTVIVPDSLRNGGRAAGWAIVTIDRDLPGLDALELAVRTGVVAVGIGGVPNQHIHFSGEHPPEPDEETLKAWSWVQMTRHPDHPEWAIELPNVKALVRSMDALTAFTQQLGHSVVPPVERFIVTGESKRGVATWMAGAVDSRVHAIIPIVMPLHRDVLVNWTASNLGGMQVSQAPYLEIGVYNMSLSDRQALFSIIDVYNYMDRLTMPKLVMNVGNDEFFPPDSTRAYYSSLPGPKSFSMTGPAHHGGYEANPFMYDQAEVFIRSLIYGLDLPRLAWNVSSSNGIISARHLTGPPPRNARLWKAHTPGNDLRDFRQATWSSEELLPSPDGGWLAEVAPAAGGWTGFYIDFEYQVDVSIPTVYHLSTEVSVVPLRRPFPNGSPYIPRFQRVV